MAEPSPRSGWFYLLLWIVSLAALVVLYSGSFQNKPAGDDFAAPLTEIARGNAEGPAAFFKQSAQPHNYRPIQSLLMWRFGSISDVKEQQLVWIRVLHLLCMASYLGVAVLWLRRLPIGRMSAMAAMALMVAHPVLPGAVGGVDGFAGPLASAIMWLGALAVIVWNHRLAVLLPVLVVCFLVGGVTKEYSFGLGPLAVWGSLVFSRAHRWRNAVIVGVTLVATLAALLYVRIYFTIPPGEEAGFSYLYLSPANWVKNIGLLTVASLFMGNTSWVMIRADTFGYAVVALSMMAMFIVMGLGLMWRWHEVEASDRKPNSDKAQTQPSAARWMVYLLGSMPLAAAAPILTERVSEMYAIGLVLPLAMLFGLAIDGWMSQSPAVQKGGYFGALVTILCAAISSHTKIALLRDIGEKTNDKLHAMLAALPADAKDETIAIVFRKSDIIYQPAYSVFVMNDFNQIAQRRALDWIAPERRIMLQAMVVDDWVTVQLPEIRHILLWRPETTSFELQR